MKSIVLHRDNFSLVMGWMGSLNKGVSLKACLKGLTCQAGKVAIPCAVQGAAMPRNMYPDWPCNLETGLCLLVGCVLSMTRGIK